MEQRIIADLEESLIPEVVRLPAAQNPKRAIPSPFLLGLGCMQRATELTQLDRIVIYHTIASNARAELMRAINRREDQEFLTHALSSRHVAVGLAATVALGKATRQVLRPR